MAPEEKRFLTISISGSGYSIRPAERAVLSLQARSQQLPSEMEASAATVATANALRDILAPHCPQDEQMKQTASEAGIVHYSMSTLDTQSHPQRNKDGHILPSLFTAQAEFSIKFKDFGLLNKLATQFSAMKNIKISRIEWKLTDDTAESIQGGARKLAAKDAIERAYDYAEIFANVPRDRCKERVLPSYVEESNYYNQDTRPHLHYGKGMRGTRVDSQDLQFEPEDVSIRANVTAKFQVML